MPRIGTYVYMFEDGTVKYATTFSAGDQESCNQGILDVIDVSIFSPQQYYENEWHEIESADYPRNRWTTHNKRCDNENKRKV